MPNTIGVGLVGYKFMGKSHSNAYRQVEAFFPDLALRPDMKALCGRDAAAVAQAAHQLGWQGYETDWRKLIARNDIGLIDVSTPGDSHAEIAIAAAENGKHVFCEKPLANTLAEAKQMLAAVKRAGVVNMVHFNYRRVPAVQLAKQLIDDGRIVAAAQEERFTRHKHDPGFPHHAIGYCLAEAGIAADELDHVVFYDKPFLKFERLLETYIALAPRGFRSFKMSIPLWLKEKLFQKSLLTGEIEKFSAGFDKGRLLFCEHHLSHAASAFFPSPFESAAVLTMDGVGEWATTSAATGNGNRLEIFQEIHFPHSLGLLYSAATYYTGFKVNSGEYKVMGLAPYGEPKYVDLIVNELMDLKEDGSFRLNMK